MADKDFFWFETSKIDNENHLSCYFDNPIKKLVLTDPDKLPAFFQEIDEYSKEYYVAGFMSYELGYLLEDVFLPKKRSDFPYAMFYVYKKPCLIDQQKSIEKEVERSGYTVKNLKLNISEKEYLRNVEKIRKYIYDGDIFQANYTVKYKFDFSGSALDFYQDLKKKQNASYNVFSKFDDYHILSLSPELFYRIDGQNIYSKPMKGTMKRGRTLAEDEANQKFLHKDVKNRSENVMIVDLIRNDLGKISEYGSVDVSKLYEIEKFNTLIQMTSTIKSKLKKKMNMKGLVKGLFPCGSITGAPKIRSMEIIRELEKEERNVYTGAIGFIKPGGDAVFNIAIRTLLLKGNQGEMGVGGGIVYDSNPDDEFKECKLKAHFLIDKPVKEFQLIETMLYKGGYKNLNFHMKRMKESAEYFNNPFHQKELQDKLRALEDKMKAGEYKVRVLLFKDGRFTIEHSTVEHWGNEFVVGLSDKKVNSKNKFLFHKTTNRELYNDELKIARKKNYYDVLFFNQKGELTEGCICNVYIEKKGSLYTPSINSGLLNGTFRQELLKEKKVTEKILTIEDLKSADKVYISNAVITFQQAQINGDGGAVEKALP